MRPAKVFSIIQLSNSRVRPVDPIQFRIQSQHVAACPTVEAMVDIYKLAVLYYNKIAFPPFVPTEGTDHIVGILVSAREFLHAQQCANIRNRKWFCFHFLTPICKDPPPADPFAYCVTKNMVPQKDHVCSFLCCLLFYHQILVFKEKLCGRDRSEERRGGKECAA